MTDAEIGIGKSGRRAYGLQDVSIVPSRRTRDSEDVSISWEIDAYRFEVPFLAAAMDSVTSPATAIAVGRLGGLGVLNLEGVWTRYEDADAVLAELAELPPERARQRLPQLYEAPIREDLIGKRIVQIKEAGVTAAAALTPHRTEHYYRTAVEAGVDILVIQSTVVSAQHVSTTSTPLNLKTFIAGLDTPVIVGGCANYHTALHLMRTGAAGLLVGVGAGYACTAADVLGVGVPIATAIADAAGARRDYLDESGGRYVHVIADGGMRTGGDIAKAIACGADAVMLGAPLAHAAEAPGRGWHWGAGSFHPTLPRGDRVATPPRGTLEQVVQGPAPDGSGTLNLAGALRRAMATTGYSSVKEFQRVELAVRPAR
ncbi:MAG TPA: GuaB3 family IMP dehydrogenase-related protein [Mycobacteriales bacterium]|jgi:IMP dehydrogenase|nr:GuaB3 family IMP dehydrogenase-related protein [Mycobacteriales bacterium]